MSSDQTETTAQPTQRKKTPETGQDTAATKRVQSAQMATHLLNSVEVTRTQATKAAKASGEILAILEMSEGNPAAMLMENLIEAIHELGLALARIEDRLTQIEGRLDKLR